MFHNHWLNITHNDTHHYHKVEQGIIRTGIDIAPKSFEINIIGSDGKLTSTQTKMYEKKIPLKDIILSETKRLHASGILNIYSDDLYTSLSLEEIQTRFQRMGEKVQKDDTEETLRNKLKSLERTRNIKIWHDHSDVLSHTYVSFMMSYIYDKANFLTDEEYESKYQQKKLVNVQAIVERPQHVQSCTFQTCRTFITELSNIYAFLIHRKMCLIQHYVIKVFRVPRFPPPIKLISII